MRTIQMTWDEELIELVDKVVNELKTTRSAFTRTALREAIEHLHLRQLEEKHRKGYELHPENKDDFMLWEKEQDWGDK